MIANKKIIILSLFLSILFCSSCSRNLPENNIRHYYDEFILEYPIYNNSVKEARLWGVGYALYTLSKAKQGQTAERFYNGLSRYSLGNGHFSISPSDSRVFVRHETHLLLGLSLFE